ncbi:LuxR C-terminal-related transcriptional regulator [Streptomyces sp. HUAS MG47]|uniref:helix-turn-helix transcriptional regulator n=1 Tax=Streptomyces solicamelliae TaxID=3231716 RepID=UPI0038781337
MTTSPETALVDLLESQKRSLDRYSSEVQQTRVLFQAIAEQLSAARTGDLNWAHATVLSGGEEISRALEEAVGLARSEVIGMHPGVPISPERLAEGRIRNRKLLERGIAMRSLHLSAMLRTTFGPGHLRDLEGIGATVRIAPVLPIRLVITDRRVALVSTASMEQERTAVRLEYGAVLEILVGFFDHLWVHEAVPLAAAMEGTLERESEPEDTDGDPERPSGRELALLRLMAKGLKDEAIARDLGVSPRTLRRLIADLMRRLDCDSRFQAGVEAMARGWLDTAHRG